MRNINLEHGKDSRKDVKKTQGKTIIDSLSTRREIITTEPRQIANDRVVWITPLDNTWDKDEKKTPCKRMTT